VTAADGGAAFETLIYTDCRPGQGLQGSAGLQFQARSSGADREAMSIVQRGLLYEPPSNWMRDKRPVADYPRSFGHAMDGLLVTAAGLYLGREANGGREGNQLTHSIVAADPAAYGPVRPAQLFGAPFWTDEPAPSTECPPVPAGWSPGPFGVDAAQEFVRAQPRGADLLVALLSALYRIDEPDGTRVLFIAEETAAVLGWITAATLLVPQRRALTIGFKVFTTNPAYATQPIVAVHPEWDSTTVSLENAAGYTVFDLVRNDWTEVPPTPEATLLVRLFLEEDPYDVVDLVEVTAETGRPGLAGLAIGQAMVLPGRSMTLDTARLGVDWLRDTSHGLLPQHRGLLVDQLVGSMERWPHDVLLGLDEVSRAGQVPDDRVAPVRLALIRAEIDRAIRHYEVADQQVAPLPTDVWQHDDRVAAEDAIIDALWSGIDPASFDAVLRVARRFGLRVRIEELRDVAHAFVLDWADHPERAYDRRRWNCGSALRDQLFDELTRRVQAGRADEVGDLWRIKLTPQVLTVDMPLDEALFAAWMVHANPAERMRIAEKFLRLASSAVDAPQALRRTAGALWRRATPTVDELRVLCELLPENVGLDQAVFRSQIELFADGSRPLSGELLAVTRQLYERGTWRPPTFVLGMLARDDDLRIVCGNLPRETDPDRYQEQLDRISAAGERLVSARADSLVEALLRMPDPLLVSSALAVLPGPVRGSYCERLLKAVRKPGLPLHAVTAFVLSSSKRIPRDKPGVLGARAREWMAQASDRRLKEANGQVAKLGEAWATSWAAEQEQVRRSVFTRLPWRRGGD
jgi:hypothetical protein